VQGLINWLHHTGLIAVFAAVLLEQAGVPLPCLPLLILAGAWSVDTGSSAAVVIAVAVAGSLVSDLGWYVAGARLGSRVLRMLCRLSLAPDSCVADTEHAFTRFGTRILVVAKFIPGLGLVSTAMSGVVRARLFGFVIYDIIGASLWAGIAVMCGVLFHDAIDDVLARLDQLGRWGLALLATLLALFLGQKLWKRHAFIRELRLSRISVAELSTLISQGPIPVIVDARSPGSRRRDGMIPGAIPLEQLSVENIAAVIPADREVVVYCACPNEASAARFAKRLIRLGFVRVRPLQGGIHAWQDAGFSVDYLPNTP
jgi:membrane protein DedA with SNARE-associated domain/rhodanese-related sulfurtransferase